MIGILLSELWMVAMVVTVFVLAGFTLFVRWCAFSPAVPHRKLDQLRVGMTMDQVVALLRQPRERKIAATGLQNWIYGARMKRHVLMIEFGPSHLLQSFAHGVPAAHRSAAHKDA